MDTNTIPKVSPLFNPDLARTLEQIQPPRRTLAESLSQTLSREYGLSVEVRAGVIVLLVGGTPIEFQVEVSGVYQARCEDPRVAVAVRWLRQHDDILAVLNDYRSVVGRTDAAGAALSTFAVSYLDFVKRIVELREATIHLLGYMAGIDAELVP